MRTQTVSSSRKSRGSERTGWAQEEEEEQEEVNREGGETECARDGERETETGGGEPERAAGRAAAGRSCPGGYRAGLFSETCRLGHLTTSRAGNAGTEVSLKTHTTNYICTCKEEGSK